MPSMKRSEVMMREKQLQLKFPKKEPRKPKQHKEKKHAPRKGVSVLR